MSDWKWLRIEEEDQDSDIYFRATTFCSGNNFDSPFSDESQLGPMKAGTTFQNYSPREKYKIKDSLSRGHQSSDDGLITK